MITKENDIYIILNLIKEIEPDVVLDVNMSLARIGFTARSLMNERIPKNVELIGIDCGNITDELDKKAIRLEVYNLLYNKKVEIGDLQITGEKRSLALIMDTSIDKKTLEAINPKWAIFNNKDIAFDISEDNDEIMPIQIEDDEYFFVKRLK